MIDLKWFQENFDLAVDLLGRKKVSREVLTSFRELLHERKKVIHDTETIRAFVNQQSKEIGALFKQKRDADADRLRADVNKQKSRLSEIEATLQRLSEEIEAKHLTIPNFPLADTPVGASEEENPIVRTEQYDPGLFRGRTIRPHWDVGQGMLEFERAAKMTGSMFVLYRGYGAQLLRALVQFALDLNRDTFEEMIPPHFVNRASFTATGHLPKFAEEAYHIGTDDLWAIPTGEIPLMNFYRDEVLDERDLPKRMMAYTACFRREAGAHGKDTRGLQRLHEFHKVELVALCREEDNEAMFQEIILRAENVLRLLELPYRVKNLCTGDLTFSSARVYDLEVYAPGVGKWLEVSSVGIFTDYQTRRGNIRYRDNKNKLRFVHALNGSGLATPRVIAALLEVHQQADGSIRIPAALCPYMRMDRIPPVSSKIVDGC